jgi:hypothetical protein
VKVRERTYRLTSTNFRVQTKGNFSRDYPRGGNQYGWHHHHADDLRRVVCGLGRVFGNTAALVVIPKFLGLAVGAVSQHRRQGKGKKSKSSEKARKERHRERNRKRKQTEEAALGKPITL